MSTANDPAIFAAATLGRPAPSAMLRLALAMLCITNASRLHSHAWARTSHARERSDPTCEAVSVDDQPQPAGYAAMCGHSTFTMEFELHVENK